MILTLFLVCVVLVLVAAVSVVWNLFRLAWSAAGLLAALVALAFASRGCGS